MPLFSSNFVRNIGTRRPRLVHFQSAVCMPRDSRLEPPEHEACMLSPPEGAQVQNAIELGYLLLASSEQFMTVTAGVLE